MCKKILEKHGNVIMNALGNATSIAVIAAENLVRNGYAEYERLETKTIEVEQSRGGRGNQDEEPRKSSKAKLLITLKKSKNFDENMRKFNEIRDENQKFMEKEKDTKEPETKK